MSDHRRTPDQASQGAGHELSEVRPRPALYAALLLLVLLAVVLAAIAWGFHLSGSATTTRVAGFFESSLMHRDDPRIQAHPDDDLARMRRISGAGLNDYGWEDKDAGVVHIPIQRAMELYLRRHGGEDANE